VATNRVRHSIVYFFRPRPGITAPVIESDYDMMMSRGITFNSNVVRHAVTTSGQLITLIPFIWPHLVCGIWDRCVILNLVDAITT
jgi:hypothetical protein